MDAGNVVLSSTQIVVGFTPYAVLALIAAAVSNSDVAALLPLVTVLVVAYVAMILQLFIVQPLILSVTTRLSPIPFFKAYWPTGVVAFTSESSIGTIPRDRAQPALQRRARRYRVLRCQSWREPRHAWMRRRVARVARCVRSERPGNFVLARPVPVPGGARPACVHRHSGRARHRDDHRDLAVRGGRSADPVHRDQPADLADRRYGPHRSHVAGAANTAVIVAATEKDLDKDLYYGRKEFEDEDASEDEDAVAAAQPEAKAPVEAPAAGKPSGFGAVEGASSANLLNFSPASALEGTGEEQCGIKLPGRRTDTPPPRYVAGAVAMVLPMIGNRGDGPVRMPAGPGRGA